MNYNFVPILTVIGHYMVFLYKSKWQDIDYPFGLYQTGFDYLGRSPILLAYVTP